MTQRNYEILPFQLQCAQQKVSDTRVHWLAHIHIHSYDEIIHRLQNTFEGFIFNIRQLTCGKNIILHTKKTTIPLTGLGLGLGLGLG